MRARQRRERARNGALAIRDILTKNHLMLRRTLGRIGFAAGVLWLVSSPAAAQDWTWSADANVFIGYNYQQRKFADFTAWESQNWFMLSGARDDNAGQLTLNLMMSLEPLTIGHFVYVSGTKVDPGGSP